MKMKLAEGQFAYVVQFHDYDDSTVVGVYLTEDEAEQEIDRIDSIEGGGKDEHYVYPIKVGSHRYPPKDCDLLFVFIIYQTAGGVDHVAYASAEDRPFEDSFEWKDDDPSLSFKHIAMGTIKAHDMNQARRRSWVLFCDEWEKRYGAPYE